MVLNLLAGTLLLLAAYIGWWVVSFNATWWWLASMAALVVAFGLFLRKRWAGVAWHSLAALASIAWLTSIARVALAGWPYPDATSSAVALVPGLLLLMLCGGGSVLVARNFRRPEQ